MSILNLTWLVAHSEVLLYSLARIGMISISRIGFDNWRGISGFPTPNLTHTGSAYSKKSVQNLKIDEKFEK